ncbi:MAG TPA: hypothetical protein VK776_03000 [Bryobacteraceae bacterium]|nr:hypothetical protein [Bryobacteraceae bacterium]
MFHQGATEASSDDPAADAPANQPLHKKDDDPSKTATADPNTQPANPADNVPLPLKLSLNLFGPKSENGKPGNLKPEDKPDRRADSKQTIGAAPLISPLPGLIQPPVVPITSKQGVALDPNDASASDGNPRVDAEQKPASAPPAPQLAFALRMTPTGEQAPAADSGHIKGADSPAGSAVNAAQLVQARESASADSNSSNHHSANQQSDPGLTSDAMPPASTLTGGGSYQAVHATALDATPAPAAPAPAPPQTPSQLSQIATHAPANLHSDADVKVGTASELSFSVSASDQQKVEVRVTDHAGEVRVSVRTPNEELASTLRSDLGSLTGKLNQSGYTTEAFAPAAHSGEFSRDQSNSPANQQQGGGQDRNFNRQGQQQDSQQDGRARRPQWLDELENSMANTTVRKEGR